MAHGDDRLDEISERIRALELQSAKVSTQMKSVHHALIGNGQPGMIAEFQQAKGSIKMAKFLGSSGIISAIAAIIAALKL
jgi:hypothetical protein